MGFDIYGLNPKNEMGQSFTRSGWSWRPIANYILDMVPANITEKCKYWHSNDGMGLDESDTLKLCEHLRQQLDNETMTVYKKGYECAQSMVSASCSIDGTRDPNHYFFSIGDMQEFCDFLENCGGFTIN